MGGKVNEFTVGMGKCGACCARLGTGQGWVGFGSHQAPEIRGVGEGSQEEA